MTDPTVTTEWFKRLYEHCPGGWVSLFAVDRTTGDRHVEWAPPHQPDALSDLAHRHTGTCDVWAGVATRRERLDGNQRGGIDACDVIPAIWLDIDIAGPGHRTGHPLPATTEEAMGLLADYPVLPTVVVHSGGGLQPWWFLDEPADAATLTPFLARWAYTWQQHAKGHGWHIDNVSNVDRIMRVPGTTNRKVAGDPRPVEILEADWSLRYGVDDLDEWCQEPPAPTATPHRASSPYEGPERPGDAFNDQHGTDEILDRLGFHSPHRKRNGDTDYVRSGKTKREGYSATVYGDDGHATIWSDTCTAAWPALELRRPYDPFGLLCATVYGGDWAEATRALADEGYGAEAKPDLTWLDAPVAVPGAPGGVAVIAAPAPEKLPPPRELPGIRGSNVPFPLDALPDWIAEPVTALAVTLQVPVDLPATIALGCLASLTQGKVHVITPGTKWAEWTNLYLALAMHVGEGKSPAYKALTRPVYDLERQHRGAMRDARREAEVRRGILENRKKKAENGAATSGDPASTDEAVRLSLELDALVIPPDGQMISDDATPEALAVLMAEAGGRMTIMSPEGIVFNSMAGAYVAQGDKVNMDVYIKGFGGESLRQNRIGRGSIDIDRAILTISVCTQPEVLEELSDTPALAQRGATARFMYSVPSSMVGRRDRSKKYEECDLSGWEAGAESIGRRFLANDHPITLSLTEDAKVIFDPWDQDVEDRCIEGRDLEKLAAWAQKLRSCVLRVAGLLAVADEADEIDADTMERATTIGDYWIEHAKVVHRMWGVEDNDLTMAKRIGAWLTKKYPEGGTVKLSAINNGIYNSGAARAKRGAAKRGGDLRGAAVLVPSVEVLVAHGWLVPVDPLWITEAEGGRRSPEFVVPRMDLVENSGSKDTENPIRARQTRDRVKTKKEGYISLSDSIQEPVTPRKRERTVPDVTESYPQAPAAGVGAWTPPEPTGALFGDPDTYPPATRGDAP